MNFNYFDFRFYYRVLRNLQRNDMACSPAKYGEALLKRRRKKKR